MSGLDGQVALVTGGSRGIGAAICEGLSAAGARVMVADLAVDADSAALLERLATEADFCGCDVADVGQVRDLVGATVDRFGRIDVLVNNAGRIGEYRQVEEVDEEAWDRCMALHLKGPFFAAQAAVPHMRANGSGRILNVASELAFSGYDRLIDYASAKAGLLTMTRSLALALAPTINVNAIAPGPVATERFRQGEEFSDENRDTLPLARWGTPRDIALTATFLAGEGGDFYTGQHLDPNGGAVMP